MLRCLRGSLAAARQASTVRRSSERPIDLTIQRVRQSYGSAWKHLAHDRGSGRALQGCSQGGRLAPSDTIRREYPHFMVRCWKNR
jgi:hypothetical protein